MQQITLFIAPDLVAGFVRWSLQWACAHTMAWGWFLPLVRQSHLMSALCCGHLCRVLGADFSWPHFPVRGACCQLIKRQVAAFPSGHISRWPHFPVATFPGGHISWCLLPAYKTMQQREFGISCFVLCVCCLLMSFVCYWSSRWSSLIWVVAAELPAH